MDAFSAEGRFCSGNSDLTPHGKDRKIFTKREPVRAISAITPFNHPLNSVAYKIASSVATNNCMVSKPTELTPLTAMTLADILYEAGLPPEMFQVVTGLPEDIGDDGALFPPITVDHVPYDCEVARLSNRDVTLWRH